MQKGNFEIQHFPCDIAEAFMIIHAVIDQRGVRNSSSDRKPISMLDDAMSS